MPVTQGATPQIDQARSVLWEHMAGGQGVTGMEALSTYLTEDVRPEAIAGFFEAAAELYRRRPWERVPDDRHLFQVSCGALGMGGWTGCVIGQNREHYGVILFDSLQDYGRYVELGERAEQGDEDAMRRAPPHRAIHFESKRDMPQLLLKEIQRHRWPVAGGDAFPTHQSLDLGDGRLPAGCAHPADRDTGGGLRQGADPLCAGDAGTGRGEHSSGLNAAALPAENDRVADLTPR